MTAPTETGGEAVLPEAAVSAFPSIEEIMRKGIVRRM